MTGIVIQSIILYIAGVAFGYLLYQTIRKVLFKLKGATTTKQYILRLILFTIITIIFFTIFFYGIIILHMITDYIFLYR